MIVGPYFGNEDEQAGTARAERVKALFTELPSEDIYTAARAAGDCETTKEMELHELKYKWVIRNEDVIEHFDRTLVFYKYDSDQEITNNNVLKFFEQLSTFLEDTSRKVVLIGHTSDEGEEDYNQELGLKRATEFKDHLISLGVRPEQVSVQSKGETQPIASNETEEGRAKNRRVEIQIIE